jgi:peptidoglycan/xylan/chitin deacetylase (PgdA/CDA1 family)
MRIILLRRRVLLFFVLIISAVLLAALSIAPAAISASGTKRQLPIYCVQRDYKTASLTFDAAWGNEDTDDLIEILGRYDVRATFFVVGAWARKYPESVKALSDAGHEVMSHSDTHKHMPTLTREQILADINSSSDAIEKITSLRPSLFRAPYGEYDDKLITTVRSMGMETIQWDVDKRVI